MTERYNLIWVDGLAGFLVGVAMFALSHWLAPLYDLPLSLLYFMGGANLMYGTYSLTLAPRSQRPRALIHLLIVANLGWGMLCFVLAARYWSSASWLGLAHLIGEGLIVGGLACVEWRWREHLYTRPE